jgi:hypothetical protein
MENAIQGERKQCGLDNKNTVYKRTYLMPRNTSLVQTPDQIHPSGNPV